MFSTLKEKIIIIDNYANKKIIVLSSNINEELIKKYQKQYNNVSLIYNNTFHDRFIIIDKKDLYTQGSSFKDISKKCFAINKIDDKKILSNLLEKLCQIIKI